MKENIVKISIDGTTITKYKILSLNQRINNHHNATLILDLATAETEDAQIIDKSKTWLGKKISIMYGAKKFSGVVSNINMKKKLEHGIVTVSGYSDTYKLESAETMYSWTDKTLKDIVQEVVDRAGIKAQVNPEYTGKIAYESQYNEKDFTFIKKLAKQYHEWLYYDGEQLVFGKPSSFNTVSLKFGTDLSTMDIGIQTLARPSKSYSYHSTNVEQYDASSPDAPSGLNELGQAAFNASLEIFKTPGNRFSEQRVNTKKEIDDHSKKIQESQVANSHYITATSECTDLAIGTVVDITSTLLQKKGVIISKPIGSYIITEITHHAGERQRYSNSFKAIPSAVPTLPAPQVTMPIAHTQMATVLSNEDPDKKGRVQVQMLWQTGDMKTSWIRVLSPSAGRSDNLATNRGMVFIPEKDDQVLVCFRYNNPNRPFVMGSLFNGQTGAGGDTNNKIKSITTRSGCTITFDDDEGEGKITVSDPSGSTITLNGDKTISISAPDSISINSKEISLNAEEKVTINGTNNVDISSKEIKSSAETEFTVESGNKITESSTVKEESHTKYKLEVQATIDMNANLSTNIKGTTVNLN